MGDQVSIGTPPWHLWGTSETLNLAASATAAPPEPKSAQMARIAYKRPETWRFFVAGEIQQRTIAAGGGSIFCNWSLTMGVGRSQITIPDWIVMKFPITGAATDIRRIWSTTAPMPTLDGTGPVDPVPRVSETVSAQDIQLQAVFTLFAASDITATFRLDAYFSPNVHVRPDWFDAEFYGGEKGGR